VFSRILVVAIAFSGTSGLAGDMTKRARPVVSNDGNHFSQRFSRGKDVIVVEVRVRAFQKAKHRLRLLEGSVQQVDGREPQGIDGGPPEGLKSELVSISVSWNGIRRVVDKSLISDCFNTSGQPGVLISDDFRAVMITLEGGDGGGTYRIQWVVPKEGEIVRFIVPYEELTWRLPIKPLQR